MGNKMTRCNTCGAGIAKSAKMCPACGAKTDNNKGLTALKVLISIPVVFVLFIAVLGNAASFLDDGSEQPIQVEAATPEVKQPEPEPVEVVEPEPEPEPAPEPEPEPEPVIEYTKITVDRLIKDFEENAYKAKETHTKEYVELTGRVGTISSDGDSMELYPMDSRVGLFSYVVNCSIKSKDLKSYLLEIKEDDQITVRGQITSVGELLGYRMDLEAFVTE